VFLAILVLTTAGGLLAQPAVFKLQVPEVSDQLYDSDVVEIPGNAPSYVLLRVLNPVAADVDYGRIQTKLNGEGAGFIMNVSAGPDGKVARLNFKLRDNMKLQPGTNTIEIVATDRRNHRFYRNFLLKTHEEVRNDYFAYESRSVATPAPAAARPPEVILAQPDGPVVIGAKERSKKITVKGTVSTSTPLASLRVAGKELKAADFETEVVVTPANKSILIEAVDQAGNRAAVSIPVSRAAATKQMKIEGNRYALVIGISDYGAKGPPHLDSASRDATDFAAALTGPAGFRREDVMLLTDASAGQAPLRNALRAFVARPGPDDLLIVFFAGFGLHDPKDPSNLYLAAHDTEFGRVPESAISIDDLKSALKSNVRARQSIFLFDVNHPVGGNWATPNNNLINNYLLRMFPDDTGKAVMVGSSVSENSTEQNGRGLFARQLIEAARGQADANQDGAVTIREWFLAVSRAVRTESHGAQTPRFTLAPAERPLFAAAN
jgi:hypothetical protein